VGTVAAAAAVRAICAGGRGGGLARRLRVEG